MVCPTRDRISMLKRFVKNLYERGTESLLNPDAFELLVIADNDDNETKDFFNNNLSNYETIKLITRERSRSFNKDYMTFGASKSSGDLIWGVADDVEILTNDWNQVLLDKINKFESLINGEALANHFYNWKPEELAYYINIDCSDGDFENFSICRCSFPIITREAFQKLNFFVPEEWKFWGADYGLGEIYRRAGRVLSLSEIKVAHWSWANNNSEYKREKDSTNKNSEKISSECDMVGAVYQKEEDIILKYAGLLIENNRPRKYAPSRISFEVLADPLPSLKNEIELLDKDHQKFVQLSKEIAIVCPKCKFDGYKSSAGFINPDPCPTHGGSTIHFDYFPKNGDEYCKDYDLWSYCGVEGCDIAFNMTKKPLTCPNPSCDYRGPLDYELYRTIGSRQKAENLNNRMHSLIQKLQDMLELLQENKPQ